MNLSNLIHNYCTLTPITAVMVRLMFAVLENQEITVLDK